MPLGKQQLHHADVVGVHIGFCGECQIGRLFISALAQTQAAANREEAGHVGFGAPQIRLHDNADGRSFRADAFHEVNRAGSVGRAFHIHAHKIAVARGVGDDSFDRFLAERFVNVQAKRGQLERNICVKFFRGDAVKDAQVGVARGARLPGVCHAFAEQIEADLQPGTVAHACGGYGLIQFFAGDEFLRHPTRGFVSGDPAREARAVREFQQDGPHHRWVPECSRDAGKFMWAVFVHACWCFSRNRSASMAAMQPEPAAVTA